ncbi:uncharacterized protein YNL187W [Kluyveromyces marxianus]|uniref:Protein SWT21 n=1 Tax=Kluyveromyces marxianus (strain DMKU3-1042 / BCC 29191 / NBRC 104275) TaxID=1003335 RepID=W0T6Y0_KLUMD|nr:uncharacterized protein KLMA_20732 [Kluyveromyces marxianus DMKU3-1042]BAO39190.1 uncharacterized protein YNL187W [Kluyveromyces marxianus DMKU3-1042]BAP70708.1 uncharacterized protein YNL187W [Kluyveromyces marxianus]
MVQTIASTQDCYYGLQCNNIWDREENLVKELTETITNYDFPQLHKSYFSDKSRRSPITCSQLTWSYDGTSICGVFDDLGVRQFLIPENKLEGYWVPFTRWFINTPIVCSSILPSYSLYHNDPSKQAILCSSRDLPIRLYSLQPESNNKTSLQHYSTLNEENETFETPYAMAVQDDESGFLTGSVRNRICLYDFNRYHPIWQHQWTKSSCGKSSHKAIVSCFDEYNECHNHIRYAGTYKTEVLRIDTRIKNFELVSERDPSDSWSNGIYQIIKSDNGHYIYCMKRNAKEIDVLDTRKLGVSWKVNTLQLPFKIGKQKFKASLNNSKGLLIGSYSGEVMYWDKDCIEFGGLDRFESFGTGIKPMGSFSIHGDNSTEKEDACRVNCITTNPLDPKILAVSTSADKFAVEDADNFETSLRLIQIP